MKKLTVLLIFLISFGAMASSELPILSIKERLRLNLWSYGLSERPQIKSAPNKVKPLPEEIERPLRKF